MLPRNCAHLQTEEQEKQTILVVSSSSDVNTPDNFGKNVEASKSNGLNLHEIEISITNHEKRGEGINGFIVYRVETKVYIQSMIRLAALSHYNL